MLVPVLLQILALALALALALVVALALVAPLVLVLVRVPVPVLSLLGGVNLSCELNGRFNSLTLVTHTLREFYLRSRS